MNYTIKRVGIFVSVCFALFLCSYQATNLTTAQPRPNNSYATPENKRVPTFEHGEELIYEAEFTRSLLRSIDIADFRFTSTRIPATSEATYTLKFDGEIKSKGFFSKLFNLNFLEQITSLVEPETFAVQKTKKFDQQGKRVRESETIYDQDARKIVWTERDPRQPTREPRVVSTSLPHQVQDTLSAIYFLRTQQLEPGKTIKLSITDSGRLYEVPVRVIEKKRLKTVIGKLDTVRADVDLFGENRIINTKGEFTVWLTADRRHIPVRARVKHEYGTFEIKLKKHIQRATP